MKTAKRWIVSAGACLLALTSMSVSFGQIPTAPIPEQNNDGLPVLTEPAPIDVAPIEPMQAPTAPADVSAPAVNANQPFVPAPTPAQTPTQAPVPAPAQQQVAVPQVAPAQAAPTTTTQQPCQQCMDPCQQCPAGAYYSPSPYYGQDTRPWWLNIRPVPYTPAEHGHHGMGHLGRPMMGGHLVRDRYGRLVPIEPPFYSVRGPRDFYLDNPRPLGY